MILNQVITINEYEETELPASLLVENGYVNAFKQALERDFFSVRLKQGKLIFQAGGYVGKIKINDNIILDIRPKVPITNLDRILFNGGENTLTPSIGNRKYDTSHYATSSISNFLWSEFLKEAELIYDYGLLKKYSNNSGKLSTPRGKISPFKTKIINITTGNSYAYCSWSDRSIDTPPNRMIKYLLHKLYENIRDSPDKNFKRRVSYCMGCYSQIYYDQNCDFLHDIEKFSIPSVKDYYHKIIAICYILLDTKGLSFSNTGSYVDASSLLINMEVVFENYIRKVLSEGINKKNNHSLRVLDGNKGGNSGAKKNLLNRSPHPKQIEDKVIATPDALIIKETDLYSENIVIDMKYKVIKGNAERSDLNQIISYAASYGSKHAILIFPASGKNKGLSCLGELDGRGIFQYFYNLSNAKLEEEESIFIDEIYRLLMS